MQLDLVHSIKGFENAFIMRPGYAIEYDYFDPQDLLPSLETKHIKNLFFAGQINGTTGYEEAAAQGLIAGMNAALKVQGKESWTPRRDEAYIGVLIDDLITCGTQEPYRMFTSRAEYRLMLREDNADLRLTEKGRELGLVDDERWQQFEAKRNAIATEQQRLHENFVRPENTPVEEQERVFKKPLIREARLEDLLRRPDVSYDSLMSLSTMDNPEIDPVVADQVEIQAKYSGYIERQRDEIERQQRHNEKQIPESFDYSTISGLSAEVMEKLKKVRPTTIGHASRIQGVTPAAISLLLVFLKKQKRSANDKSHDKGRKKA